MKEDDEIVLMVKITTTLKGAGVEVHSGGGNPYTQLGMVAKARRELDIVETRIFTALDNASDNKRPPEPPTTEEPPTED